MASSRSSNYNNDEDRHLCHAYIEISQDPEIGINQKKYQLWDRVEKVYNSRKPEAWPERSVRSIDSRMQNILTATSKFKSCIQQVEYMKPSGISTEDLMKRAKEMMMLDKKFSRGFKYEHVWDIMKDFEKFSCKSQKARGENISTQSLSSNTPMPESPMSHDSIPFDVNLSDNSGSGSGSQRPLGVKKSKMKKKKGEDVSVLVNTLLENQKQMQAYYEETKKAQERRTAAIEEANELAREKQDQETILIDPMTINDPVRRMYIQQTQAEIMQKRRDKSISAPDNNFGYQPYLETSEAPDVEMIWGNINFSLLYYVFN